MGRPRRPGGINGRSSRSCPEWRGIISSAAARSKPTQADAARSPAQSPDWTAAWPPLRGSARVNTRNLRRITTWPPRGMIKCRRATDGRGRPGRERERERGGTTSQSASLFLSRLPPAQIMITRAELTSISRQMSRSLIQLRRKSPPAPHRPSDRYKSQVEWSAGLLSVTGGEEVPLQR